MRDMQCVYFLRQQGTGHVKIGFSTNILRRLKQTDTHNPAYDMVGLIWGAAQRTETALHRIFQETRVKRGDWFLPSVELEQLIDALPTAHELLAAFMVWSDQKLERGPNGVVRFAPGLREHVQELDNDDVDVDDESTT